MFVRYIEDKIRLEFLINVIKYKNYFMFVLIRDVKEGNKVIVKNIYIWKGDIRFCMKDMLRNYKMCFVICCFLLFYSEKWGEEIFRVEFFGDVG